jgi:hypothetical protein
MNVRKNPYFSHMLTAQDLSHFNREGWIGPFRLLERPELDQMIDCYRKNASSFAFRDYSKVELPGNESSAPPFIWFKSMHFLFPEFRDFLFKAALKDRVIQLLGERPVVWGVTVTCRKPGQVHRWHGDVEHYHWNGISCFIGLSNTSKRSSLKIITRSHNWHDLPQNLNLNSDEEILETALRKDANCKLLTVAIADGDFFIFSGRLWHGSQNRDSQTRLAVIAQLSTAEAHFRIPANYQHPVQWTALSPPILPLSGIAY